MSAVMNDLVVGEEIECVFGTANDEYDYRETHRVRVIQISGQSYLVDDGKGLMGRAFFSSSELRCVTTMNYGGVGGRTREEAARMLYFSI